MTDAPILLDPPPAVPARRWINALIVFVIAGHLFVPIRYYVSGGGLDERFSWRFFSSVSLMQHAFHIDDVLADDLPTSAQPLPLATLLQVGAVKKLLNTHHPDMVDAFLHWRLAQPGVRAVRYDRTSITTDGRQLPPVHRSVSRQDASP